MIDHVSPSAGAPPAATDSNQAASSSRTVYHTPFGDVMVDTLGNPDAAAGTGRPAIPPVVVHAALATSNASPAAAAPATPTLESEFGQQPYLDKPSGKGPLGPYDFNP